ncbi:MAG: amidohydrolase family protein [Gammaproteobacteria bacterium]
MGARDFSIIAWPAERVIPPSTWQPPAGTVVISADDHVIEEDLWIDRLPAKYRDRAPRSLVDEHGERNFAVDGVARSVPGIVRRPQRTGGWDIAARIRDMDAERVDLSLLFHGSTPQLFGNPDDDFMFACLDAFNEWFVEYCHQPAAQGRLHPIAILPTWRYPERTRDYIQKIKALGYRAMELPSEPRDVYYNSAKFEPMWAAIAESGIPLSFHVGPYIQFRGAGSLGANMTRNFGPHRTLWALLTFAGIFERHPDLKVVFTEGGASWAASAVDDADKIYRAWGPDLNPQLPHPPSFYWRRNCFTTFMDDPSAILLADKIGVDNILWSLDYPHPEGVFAQGEELMRGFFEHLGEEKAKKIVGGNAKRLWSL